MRTKRDPALLEFMGKGLFRTSVFPIPPGADRKVTMRYTQILKREGGLMEFGYPFGTQKFTARPIGRLALNLRIESRDPIKSLYCPTYDAKVERRGEHEATVRLELSQIVPPPTSASSPTSPTALSGRPCCRTARVRPRTGTSCSWPAPGQTGRREAGAQDGRLRARPLRLDGGQEDGAGAERAAVRPEQPPGGRHVQCRRLRTTASRRSSPSCNGSRPARARRRSDLWTTSARGEHEHRRGPQGSPRDGEGRLPPRLRLFLTDGLPTAGRPTRSPSPTTRRPPIAVAPRVFAFGVGYDVNARLLDRLSGGNSGTSEYVKPDDDIEAHVGRFYSKMTSPALTDVRLTLDGIDVNRTYPRDLPDLFEGGQLVVTGRYRQSGRTALKLSGRVGPSGSRSNSRPTSPATARGRTMITSRSSGPPGASARSSTRSTFAARTRN